MITELYQIGQAGMDACFWNEYLSRSLRRICMLRPKEQTSQLVN
jgi:hypothetical protein